MTDCAEVQGSAFWPLAPMVSAAAASVMGLRTAPWRRGVPIPLGFLVRQLASCIMKLDPLVRYGVFARFEKLEMEGAAVLVWGGGALSLGVRTVPKGPIDRANKVSSSSLAPSRYSSTPRFERHPPLPHPTSPLPRCSATAAPPARSQMAGRAAGAPRAGTGCANLPPPIAIACPARGGRPVGRGGGSAARVSSGLPPPTDARPPARPASIGGQSF